MNGALPGAPAGGQRRSRIRMSRGRLQLTIAIAALIVCAATVIAAVGVGGGGSAKGSAAIGPLRISHARMPAPASPDVGTIYLTVKNTGGADDSLDAVTADVANSGMLMREQASGGSEQMLPVPALTIPAHGQASLSPGNYHVMLIGLHNSPKQGDTVRVTLHFAHAGQVTLDVPVATYAQG